MQQLELPLLPPRDQLYRALYGGSVHASVQNMVDRHSDHHGRPALDPPRRAALLVSETARSMFDVGWLTDAFRDLAFYGRSWMVFPGPLQQVPRTERIRPDDTFEWSREMARYCRSDVELRAAQSDAARARNRRAFLQGRRADLFVADDLELV